jgi:nucleoside-diphosphate-sugar epimerase
LERDEAVGEVFNLSGAALFDWGEAVPYLAERYGMGYAEARRPDWNYFELDIAKIKAKLGFVPEHDLASVLDAAEAIRRGEDVGVIPTGVRFGKA